MMALVRGVTAAATAAGIEVEGHRVDVDEHRRARRPGRSHPAVAKKEYVR